MMNRFFSLKAHDTNVQTEFRAGLTTFLTMSYILFLNPQILHKAMPGVPIGQLMTTTALAAAIGSVLMGVIARYPFGLAPGMGLNAYFSFVVVGGGLMTWEQALGAVFISGVLMGAMSFMGIRTLLLQVIPKEIKLAISAGIGLFLAFIGAQNCGLIVDHPATFVTLGDLSSCTTSMSLLGVILMLALMHFRVPGTVLLSIAVITFLGIVLKLPIYPGGKPFSGFADGFYAWPSFPEATFFALDIKGALMTAGIGILFTFTFVDLFDTAGTLLGLSRVAPLEREKNGELKRTSLAFFSDALATCFGALLGTSSTTSYLESASGIQQGGRTGLTAIFVGLLFLLSMFFWPLAAVIPTAATAPVLIVVGFFMMNGLGEIDWNDHERAFPAFLTFFMMPLTFSIANGMSLGLVCFVTIQLVTGKIKQVHWFLLVLSALLLVKLFCFGPE